MPRAPNEKSIEAYNLYKKDMKLVDIATKLEVPASTVRRWKSTQKWDSERSDSKSERSVKRPGGKPGNKNAIGNDGGAPTQNKNAEKYGFFSKYLPQETLEIFNAVEDADPLDLIWHQIQIAYAAIVRAQQIMYVKDIDDMSKTKIGQKDGETVTEERWEVQYAWDKQANFLKAQARAQGELRSLIKQYDEMLHKNWELATEEQKARIAAMKSKVQGNDPDDGQEDDGFLNALNGSAAEDWADEED